MEALLALWLQHAMRTARTPCEALNDVVGVLVLCQKMNCVDRQHQKMMMLQHSEVRPAALCACALLISASLRTCPRHLHLQHLCLSSLSSCCHLVAVVADHECLGYPCCCASCSSGCACAVHLDLQARRLLVSLVQRLAVHIAAWAVELVQVVVVVAAVSVSEAHSLLSYGV